MLPLLCSMSLISPNFDVKSIIFSQFWPGAFPKIAGKSPVPIGQELNEITPTTIGRLDILLQPLGHRTSGDLLWVKPNLDSRCRLQVLLRSWRRVSRKKWSKLESPAGNVRVQNKSWRKNMPDSAFPRTLPRPKVN